MNTQASSLRCYGFDFPRLDTVVEVKVAPEGVVILASRDTFSWERRQCFIRELVAEGFIDESCVWRTSGGPGGARWIVDPGEFMPGANCRAETGRFVLRVFFSAVGLWWLLMGCLVLRPGG